MWDVKNLGNWVWGILSGLSLQFFCKSALMLKVGIGLDRAQESCKVGKSWLTDKIMHPHELKGVNELTC